MHLNDQPSINNAHESQCAYSVYQDKVVARIKNYIDEHYLESLSLMAIADKFHLAPAHLTTRFRRGTGLPVMKCVLEKRMDEAKYLLVDTSQTVQVIAEQVGYTDLGIFSRQFRRHFGVSPSHWRKHELSEKKANRAESWALLKP